ncbi:hypothetical protein bcere0022_9830 [Bacillus cereus Rock3-44]|nr:hypothetical protein bcere0022_9830 [Bacillus cereus Rock3-44]
MLASVGFCFAIIEGESIEEIRENISKELKTRNATYMHTNWLNN